MYVKFIYSSLINDQIICIALIIHSHPNWWWWCIFFTSSCKWRQINSTIYYQNWSYTLSYIFDFPFPLPLPLIVIKTSFYTLLEQKFVFLAYLLWFSINPIISSKFLYLTILPLSKPNIILYIHIEKNCLQTLWPNQKTSADRFLLRTLHFGYNKPFWYIM